MDKLHFRAGILFIYILLSHAKTTVAQYESILQSGEFGVQLGAAHYFGDLNMTTQLNRPHPAFGVFFRKQLNNYAALRVALNYFNLSYSDKLQAKNEFQRRRNLDFQTSILEFLLQGDFNFFRFNPINPSERFTPYLTFGAGFFYYNPYTYLGGIRYDLRGLGTEGQNSSTNPGKEYSTMAICLPAGFGIKWSLNNKINMHVELTHRFTTTDYIDDVSGNYAGTGAFIPETVAYLLQDRSYETGATPIGIEGNQRGFKGNKDQFTTISFGMTINFSTYRCPGTNLK